MRTILLITASVSLLQACGTTRNHEPVGSRRHQELVSSETAESNRLIEGGWGYATQCNQGHFIAITLRKQGDRFVGSWSDGTLLGGSDGDIEVEADSGRFIAKRCGSDKSSGLPPCPRLENVGDHFRVKHGSLYWYQAPDNEPYAILDQQSNENVAAGKDDCEHTP